MVDANTRLKTVLDDPGLRSVAQGYVTAYLDAARDSGVDVGEAVGDLKSLVDDVLLPDGQLREVLLGGVLSDEQELAVIDKAIAPRVPQVLANLLRVLCVHDRTYLLPVVAKEAGIKFDEMMGRQLVRVIAAQPVDEGRFAHIRQSLDSALPFEPIVEVEVDPSLLGGLVVQVGDKVYDASLRTRLNQLRERLVARRVGT